jgi:hypothetical protein
MELYSEAAPNGNRDILTLGWRYLRLGPAFNSSAGARRWIKILEFNCEMAVKKSHYMKGGLHGD